MIKTILPGSGNTGGIMTPVISFDMIFDTDVGLLCLILRDYMNPEVFNKDFFFKKRVIDLVYELYIRKEKNPINLCINDKYRDKSDDFYNQFMEQEYDKILDLSVFTEFYRLIRVFKNEPDINPVIMCKNEKEMNYLLRFENTSNITHILYPIDKSIMQKYNQYYFKSIDDSKIFADKISDKTVYFGNYGFNKDDDGSILNNETIFLLSRENVINLIDVYSMSKLKGGTKNVEQNNL